MFCFIGKTFDLERFVSPTQSFPDNDNDHASIAVDASENVRAKIISRVVRKAFEMLSLTKRQMDVLNRPIKAIVVFANPNISSFAKKIHAECLSCSREGQSHLRLTDTVVKSCFDTREHF